MSTYTARVGTENAAWLAGWDGPLAGNIFAAIDNGDGSVTLSSNATDFLAQLAEHHDGVVSREPDGTRWIRIEGTGYELTPDPS